MSGINDAILAAFFDANANGIRREEIRDGGPRANLMPWLDRLAAGAATVLPRASRVGGQSRVTWYGLATSRGGMDRLSLDVMSFVGPSHSTFRGELAAADEGDAFEQKLAGLVPGGLFLRFEAVDGGFDANANRRLLHCLERMRLAWATCPPRSSAPPASVDALLRDLTLAISNGRRPAAERVLGELRDRSLLDPMNLAFVRLRLLARLGTPAEVLSDSSTADVLLRGRRPPAVTQALAAAVARVHLTGDDPVALVAAMRERVLPEYGPLFDGSGGRAARAGEALRAFAVRDAAAAIDGIDPRAADRLVALRDDPSTSATDRGLASALLNLPGVRLAETQPAELGSGLAAASAALEAGDFEAALRLAADAAGAEPADRAELLFQAAHEVDTLDAARIAMSALAGLEEDDRLRLLSRRFVRDVAGNVVDPVTPPASWSEWLAQVADPAVEASHVRRAARAAAAEWSHEAHLAVDDAPERLSAALTRADQDVPAERKPLLRELLPDLIGFLTGDPHFPRRSMAGVYLDAHLLGHMMFEGGPGELSVLLDLLDGPLRLGLDQEAYEEHVDYAADHVRRGGPTHLDWMLDLVDTLATRPVPGEAGRGARAAAVDAVAAAFASLPAARVGVVRTDLLRALCRELELPDPLPASPDPADEEDDEVAPLRALLDGRRLGIYSLDDGTPSRVVAALSRLVPRCRVEINSDADCTGSLRAMAAGCDLVVVATRKASHAATGCIDKHGGRGKLIYPAGGGSSSVLAALEDEAAKR
jgi:hypothetical protein